MAEATNAATASTTVKADPMFTREQFAASKKYAHQADLVMAVLKDGQQYTITAADAAIKTFLGKELK